MGGGGGGQPGGTRERQRQREAIQSRPRRCGSAEGRSKGVSLSPESSIKDGEAGFAAWRGAGLSAGLRHPGLEQ